MARYDGVAEWYDAYVRPGGDAAAVTALADDLTRRLLTGRGPGWCLEVGCGGGTRQLLLADLGWSAVGVDLSHEQLRIARARLGPRPSRAATAAPLLRADAARLPLADSAVDAVVSVMTTTDLEDLTVAVREMARVLRPGGHLVVVGLHPCFGMSFVSRDGSGAATVHPGYRDHRWVEDHPLLGDGIRRRVGAANVPLPALLNPISDAGLVLERVLEDSGREPIPQLLGVQARCPR